MSALKVIPWGDVIEAAPGLVKGARKMFTRTQEVEAEAEVASAAVVEPGDLGRHVARLDARLLELAEQQKATARLIETLAQQNARVVEAVELLRVRTRLLMGACGVLAAALIGVVAVMVWGGPA